MNRKNYSLYCIYVLSNTYEPSTGLQWRPSAEATFTFTPSSIKANLAPQSKPAASALARHSRVLRAPWAPDVVALGAATAVLVAAAAAVGGAAAVLEAVGGGGSVKRLHAVALLQAAPRKLQSKPNTTMWQLGMPSCASIHKV